jgi:WD40 repeat protein
MKRFHGRIARVCALAYSPGGDTLASGGDGGLIRLWDARLGEALDRFRMGDTRVNSLDFRPDGSMIAAAYGYGGSHLWSLTEGRHIRQLHEWIRHSFSLDFRPDGAALVTSGGEYLTAVVWAIPSLEPIARFSDVNINCVAYHPGGALVAVGSSNPRISIWDPARFPASAPIFDVRAAGGYGLPHGTRPDEVQLWTIPHPTGCRCLRFSPDGRTLAASSGWSVIAYDVQEGRQVSAMKGHRQIVKSLHYSPDGRLLASASQDGTVRIWDAETGESRACYDWEIGKVDSVAFAPDGMTIAAGGEGGIVVWDVDR